jgi:hypothetical protein
MPSYYDRYSGFRYDGSMKPMPGLYLTPTSTDKNILYKLGETRLDKLSNTYYNSPYFGWLIMSANPQFGGLEFNITDQAIITVPFPFESAIDRYTILVNRYKSLYGGQ